MLDWAKARWGSRPTIAINNGYHVDNLGGNAALRAAGVATVVIPGHGDRTDASLIQHTLGVLARTPRD